MYTNTQSVRTKQYCCVVCALEFVDIATITTYRLISALYNCNLRCFLVGVHSTSLWKHEYIHILLHVQVYMLASFLFARSRTHLRKVKSTATPGTTIQTEMSASTCILGWLWASPTLASWLFTLYTSNTLGDAWSLTGKSEQAAHHWFHS